ncbi:MAG: ABC transporter permease [Candidatus Methanoplasma sp.]|jgi:ABC-2 type transport system permease protein|nr:ABC transporter permease [Candidatus Methanoplasma sp.]
MSISQTARIIVSTTKITFISRFTVTPPIFWLIQILATTFFTMFFFSVLADYVDNPEATVTYVVIGNAVQSIAATTLYSVAEIPSVEKHVGTLGALMQSPSSMFTVFIGMSVFSIFSGMVSVTLSLSYAAFIFGVSFASCNFAAVILIMVLTCLSLTGMGMVIGGIGLHLRTSAIIANVVAYIGLLISGVNFPVSYLPEWVQAISYCMPLTYAVEATRDAVNGASIVDLAEPLGMMILLGAIFFVISLYTFKFFEKKSRTAGRLDSF